MNCSYQRQMVYSYIKVLIYYSTKLLDKHMETY